MSKIYRAYTPAEVIDGWREIVMSRGPSARSKPSSLERPGKSNRPNVSFLMWIHVEVRFLVGPNKKHREGLYSGDDLESCGAFSDWCREHPFQVVPDADETGKRELPELVYIPLNDACKALGVNPQTVRKSIQRARVAVLMGKPCPSTPNIIKPAGSPAMTTIAEIARWKDQEAA